MIGFLWLRTLGAVQGQYYDGLKRGGHVASIAT